MAQFAYIAADLASYPADFIDAWSASAGEWTFGQNASADNAFIAAPGSQKLSAQKIQGSDSTQAVEVLIRGGMPNGASDFRWDLGVIVGGGSNAGYQVIWKNQSPRPLLIVFHVTDASAVTTTKLTENNMGNLLDPGVFPDNLMTRVAFDPATGSIQARSWLAADLENPTADEPGTWPISITDSSIASGWVGLVHHSENNNAYYYEVAAGTDGDPAVLSAGSDTTAPTVTSPTSANVGETTADVGATSDEGGTGYAVVVPSGATAPTGSQVVAGTDGTDSPATASAQAAVTASSAFSLSMTGLTGSTVYDYYVTAEDAAGNVQQTPVSGSFTTTAPALTSTTRVEDKTGTALANETGINAWFYENESAAPTDEWTGETTDANGDLALDYTNAAGTEGTLVIQLANGNVAVAKVTPA